MSKKTSVAALIMSLLFMLNAFGQVTGSANRKPKIKKTLGFRKGKPSRGKWECPEFDAAKNIKSSNNRAKPKDYIGETEKNFSGKRRSSKSKVREDQDIEVENDETHRTKRQRKH